MANTVAWLTKPDYGGGYSTTSYGNGGGEGGGGFVYGGSQGGSQGGQKVSRMIESR